MPEKAEGGMKMTKEDMMLELDRLKAQMESLEETRRTTIKQIIIVMNAMQTAMQKEDYETLHTCFSQADMLQKQADIVVQMIDNVKADTRKLCVTIYGPAGGIIYDSIMKKWEGS
jgi:hypothetical protein